MRLSLKALTILRRRKRRLRKARMFSPNRSVMPANASGLPAGPEIHIRKPEFRFDHAETDKADGTYGAPVEDLRFLQAALRVWEIRNGVTD